MYTYPPIEFSNSARALIRRRKKYKIGELSILILKTNLFIYGTVHRTIYVVVLLATMKTIAACHSIVL